MKYFFVFAALLAVIALGVPGPAQPELAATYLHGTLQVTIPNSSGRSGDLTIEVLNPEDQVIGRVQRHVEPSSVWVEEIPLSKPLPVDDLVWHRVRYRLAGTAEKIEATESISNILRRPVLHIVGQRKYLAGANAAVRVIVTDNQNQPVSGASTLRIEGEKGQVLFTGRLNARGTADAEFRLPATANGTYPLRYAVETPLGGAEYSEQVRVEDEASILLTTEKPVYQPGQTIHVRALALDRARHQATASRDLSFEVEDPRGNKVFRKAAKTDRFGIASAEFSLADEVNLGTYHLRAVMGGNRAEVALNVERYVLPKFKVAVEFDGKAHGYRPGDHVKGTVRANYFFGKPVDRAEVTVKASGMDVTQFEAGSVNGKTDADGVYHFDLTLPKYFAGRALSQGAARLLVEATVKDSAGHAETRGEGTTVSDSPLLVTAVPEGGTMVPHLENQVFLVVSYADGKPASADVIVRAAGNRDQAVKTDAAGVAVIRVKDATSIQVEARDGEGNRASVSAPLEQRQGNDQVLLHADRAVYRVGDRMALRIFSTKSRGAVYVDIVKDGQTVLTRDVDLVNGQAELDLDATASLAGTLDLNAYVFGRDALAAGDHRLLFVQPADDLKIETNVEAASYRPGDDARIKFRVTNSRGQGVQAALGLQVVDEAVFALAEKQPGFAKVFFFLEQEAMKPRYEIHSLSMDEAVAGPRRDQDLPARALFAATEMNRGNRMTAETGRFVPMTKSVEYADRYRAVLVKQVKASTAGLDHLQLTDSWGTKVQIDRNSWGAQTYFMARSAGPDKQFNTPDDVMAAFSVKRRVVGRPGNGPSTLELNLEHDRGPFNGRAEISGLVTDQNGGALDGASVTLVSGGGASRTARVSVEGRFSLSAVPPGPYEIVVSSGAETLSRKFELAARDRAVLTASLRHQAGDEILEMPMQWAGNAGGAPGGVLGGVLAVRRKAEAAPMAMPAPRQQAQAMLMAMDNLAVYDKAPAAAKLEGGAAPRTRSYFPEALYINPEIITDASGNASITIPLADSITTWRMALMASTPQGALGSATGSIKVFQDFFTDLDLPVTLTQGDRVSLPVAVYNYSGAQGRVDLELKPADWYTLVEDTPDKNVAVDSGRVGGSQFTIQAKRIGKFKLTLSAHMGGRADIVVREIEVLPDGREQSQVFNGRLENAAAHAVTFPVNSIPEARSILVRLYPGPLSQVIEGMDSILRMPGGCFEQTSSSTYPNVLALDYMKRTKKLTPEVHAKAEGFIANGYQRLLTFEVPGGGFSWFGNPPANKILTAYGLMEFSDMSKVHDVDPKLIQRTQEWLAGQQQADGSWKPDTQFINEGATNRFNTDVTRITAYLGWALENTGYRGPAVDRAADYVKRHLDGHMDAYTLAVAANFAVEGKDRDFTSEAMRLLLDAKTEKDDQAWWTAQETAVYATGASAAAETTGLAVQALLKWGQASETARRALAYLASKKDASGTWGTTQATIMALRALLLSTETGAADVRGTVEITLNGKTVQTLALTDANNDLFHQFVFKTPEGGATQDVGLRFNGKGGLAYQVAGRYFVPWTEKPTGEPLSITVSYDRTSMAQNDIATATAVVRNNLPKTANMLMVDLGIPPGFDLLSEDLQAYQEKSAGQKSGRLEKFTQTATQAILYFDALGAGDTVTLKYRLRAKYPIRARTFQSRVYEYYDPAVRSVARPVQLEVKK